MSRSCLQYWQRNEDQIRASVASGHGAGYKVGSSYEELFSSPYDQHFLCSRCLVASNVGRTLPWKRLLLTGCKKGRSLKTARWWSRKSQNRLWCSTDRWGVRANSQQVKVGWSASSRDMNCENLLLKRRNPKSFRVPYVERDWAASMLWKCTRLFTQESGHIFVCSVPKTFEERKSWSTMRERTLEKSHTNATYVERPVWMHQIWKSMRRLTPRKISQLLKLKGTNSTQNYNFKCKMYWQVLRIDECYFNRWSVLFVRITKTDIMKDADNIESQVIISSLVIL